MPHRLSSEVGRALYGCVPKRVEAAPIPRDKRRRATDCGLSVRAYKLSTAAFLVEVHAYLLCVPDAAVDGSSHIARGYKGGKTCTVLYGAVVFVKTFAEPIQRFLDRYLPVVFFQFAFDGTLALFYIPYAGVACLAAVLHEQVEHLFRLVAHVERPVAMLCKQYLHRCRVRCQHVLMEAQSIARAFLYPYHRVGIHHVSHEVRHHEVRVARSVDRRQPTVDSFYTAHHLAYFSGYVVVGVRQSV